MPNKTYADILGEKATVDIPLTEYIRQEVSLKDDPNNKGTLETEYQLYLQSKKLKKPKIQISENHVLEWKRVGDLYYSPKVNARSRQEKFSDRKKIYSLASEFNIDYLDAIHVQVIKERDYVGEGMKRATSALLNYGPDYEIPCLVDYTNAKEGLTNDVVKRQNNIFESINNGRDRLDSFTYYFTNYVQGDPMAKAIIETMKKTGYNFTPYTDTTPVYNGLKTIENIFDLKISGDDDKIKLQNRRGPNILTAFRHHRAVYGDETPHNAYIRTIVAFIHHFDSDDLTVSETQLNYIMNNAKDMKILSKEKNNTVIKVGIKTGNDFASKWGQGLKGKSGIPVGMQNLITIWNKCYDNLPGAKSILRSSLDPKYIEAIKVKSYLTDYSYKDYLENPLTGEI